MDIMLAKVINVKKILSFIIVGMLLLSMLACTNKNEKDMSQLTDSQVVEYLCEQGFEFQADELESVYTTQYIYVSSNENEIIFQKIINPIIGILYTWRNGDVNDSMAEVKSTYKNDTEEEKQQYREFEKWLNYHGLTVKQFTDALDYYHSTVTEYNKLPTTID